MNASFQPSIDTPLTLKIFSLGSRAENLILIHEEKDKENSPPLPTTQVSERPTQLPVLVRSCPFGTRIENVND